MPQLITALTARTVTGLLLLLSAAAANLHARDDAAAFGPDPDARYPTAVYWGDTHVHTAYSSDSFLFGNTNLTPDQAYRFARGETVETSTGMRARLERPLDFLVVADHAENLGMMKAIREREPAVMKLPGMERWFEALESVEGEKGGFTRIFAELGNPSLKDPAARGKIWRDSVALADDANTPGAFTALVGFEWSPTAGGNNLHRVVVFRDGAGSADQVLPFAAFDSEDPRDLWRYLADYKRSTGNEALAISHNGNGSNGLMFPAVDAGGEPLDRDYAEARSRWEPLIEVVQYKGDAEAHPLLSPDDAFADFYTWDRSNLLVTAPKEPWMLQHEYARPALKLGLKVAARTGVNPYRFGMIGSTDSHTSLASADDNNFWGGHPGNEPAPDRLDKVLIPSTVDGVQDVKVWEQAAAGYAAVWATDNTRGAIFDALSRREVYASTGPRITLRFFGGWDFDEHATLDPDYVRRGYERGVPMGAELPSTPQDQEAPVFMVAALKDPHGANLDRVQIVKGWLDADGNTREQVYNVSWSDGRQRTGDGTLAPVGSSVDGAGYSNRIGAPQLTTTWRDPDFDPRQQAFYYVRVLEIPTPHWSVYDAKRFGFELKPEYPREQQERAYSSPIWYTPD